MTFSINFDHSLKDKDSSYYDPDFKKSCLEDFKDIINDSATGFFKVTERKELLESCLEVNEKFKDRKTFVHVGIGGSSLGPEMLISALAGKKIRDFRFINNIDPDRILDQLSDIDLLDSVFYFVSKSGGTAETMAALAIIVNLLKSEGVKKEQLKDYFVFATDPVKSSLLELGKELGITCLEVPSNVGGRFSVLTPVGFLPALFAGINCQALLDGANAIKPTLLANENSILFEATSTVLDLKDRGHTQTVFMPYSSRLRDLSFWFIQLWAESLGKKVDSEGNVVHEGLTPIPAYGATDQHSQVQLFMEGPLDKLFFMLEVDTFNHDYSLANDFTLPTLTKLAPHSLSDLMKAELQGTLKALSEANRPFLHIKLSGHKEDSLGALILFFESLTALVGRRLNIDPFNQPGVEAGKIYAYEWLLAIK